MQYFVRSWLSSMCTSCPRISKGEISVLKACSSSMAIYWSPRSIHALDRRSNLGGVRPEVRVSLVRLRNSFDIFHFHDLGDIMVPITILPNSVYHHPSLISSFRSFFSVSRSPTGLKDGGDSTLRAIKGVGSRKKIAPKSAPIPERCAGSNASWEC